MRPVNLFRASGMFQFVWAQPAMYLICIYCRLITHETRYRLWTVDASPSVFHNRRGCAHCKWNWCTLLPMPHPKWWRHVLSASYTLIYPGPTPCGDGGILLYVNCSLCKVWTTENVASTCWAQRLLARAECSACVADGRQSWRNGI